jgi:peptidoglycan/LPS O-acetylase OafA/YrhL
MPHARTQVNLHDAVMLHAQITEAESTRMPGCRVSSCSAPLRDYIPQMTDPISPPDRSSKHHMEFEALRAYMAWWVVIGHVFSSCGYYLSSAEGFLLRLIGVNGHAVSIFIMLSGMLMFMTVKPGHPYGSYIVRRALRIFPVYLVILILALLIADATLVSRTMAEWRSDDYVQSYQQKAAMIDGAYVKHVLLHFALLQGAVPDQWLPYSGEAFIAPAWSLSLEWQFYLLVPLLVAANAKGRILLPLISLMFFAFKYILVRNGYTFSYGGFLPVKFEYFAVGMSSALFLRDLESEDIRKAIWRQLPMAVVLMASIKINKVDYLPIIGWAVFLLVFIAAKRYNLSVAQLLMSAIANRPAVALGRLSYSTYLAHPLVIDLVIYSSIALGFSKLQKESALAWLIAPILVLTLIASKFLYEFVEQPGIATGRKFS